MSWCNFKSNSIRLGENLSKSIVALNFNQIQSNKFNESIAISTLDKPIKFYEMHFIDQILSAHLINLLSNLIK